MPKNDFAVLVVDVSAENLRFEETREMAAAFVMRKLVHHSAKSQICLILIGTPGTDGNNLEYEGLTVVHDFEWVSQDLYRELKVLEQSSGRNVQYLEAMLLVFDQIAQSTGRGIWTVEFMTDGSLPQPPPGADDEEFKTNIVGQILNPKKDITLNIRGLPSGAAQSPGQQVLRCIARASAPRGHVFESLTPGPLLKPVNGNATFKMEFDWGGLLKMKVTGFIHATPCKFPTCSKRVNPKEGDPKDIGQVLSNREYHLKDDRDVKLSSEDLVYAYMYGSQAVYIEESDDLHYTEPEKSMQLIGCFPRDDILPHFLTSRTDVIYADPDFGPASQRMMAAIISAMINKDQVAVVRVVHRAKASPVLYVLFPNKDQVQGFYCFHACQLPWRLDAREVELAAFTLPSDDAKGSKVPTTQMLSDARAFVERGSILTCSAGVAKKENAYEAAQAVSVTFRHDPSGVANPAIQRFYMAVAHKLDDPNGMPPVTSDDIPSFASDDIFSLGR
jgi:Ku70/Ku80 beta-barrel domain